MQDPYQSPPPQYQPDPSAPPPPPPPPGEAYPQHSVYPPQYPSQPNYPPQQGYSSQPNYPPQPAYPQQPTYPPQQAYPPQPQPYTPYGTGPQPPRKKQPWLWVIGGVVLVLIIIGASVAAVSANKNNSPTTTPTAQTNATTVPTQASQTTPAATQPSNSPAGTHKIGDVVTIDGWQVVVNSAKISHGGQYDSPQHAGDVYLEIDVSVTNQTGKAQTFSSDLSFTLKDSTGQQYSQTFVSDAPNAPDGNIQNNSKLRGTIPYEVAPSMKSFELDFEPDPFNSTDVAPWSITVSS